MTKLLLSICVTVHVLLIAGAVVLYAITLHSFIELSSRNAFIRGNPALFAVFAVSIVSIAVAIIDAIFIFIKKRRKTTTIILGACFSVLLIFLILSFAIFGTRVIFMGTRIYLPIMCVLLLASFLFGFFISEKKIKKQEQK
ncbi:MAG: hypothetical protein FWC82_00545 [Firmicutes bacterium]|nr:hypothetical protein [Bacillota bacterium]